MFGKIAKLGPATTGKSIVCKAVWLTGTSGASVWWGRFWAWRFPVPPVQSCVGNHALCYRTAVVKVLSFLWLSPISAPRQPASRNRMSSNFPRSRFDRDVAETVARIDQRALLLSVQGCPLTELTVVSGDALIYS